MTILLLIGVATAAAALGALFAWLWLRGPLAEARAAASRAGALERRVHDTEQAAGAVRDALQEERITSTRLRERLDAERAATADKLAVLDEAQRKLGDTFRGLSADALDRNARSFLELARGTLEQVQERARGDFDARTRAIDSVVQPLRESLDRVDARIHDLERVRSEAYGTLAEQVRSLARTQLELQSETANLVRALRQPAVRGRWGEITLRRVVELAGLVAYCDFLEQETAATEDGYVRPDMLVRLPNGKNIVIDSKAPLQAYLDAIESDDDAVRNQHLLRHAQQIRSHIVKLAGRAYWTQFQPTPELVVLFLPGESFYSAALERDPSLIESGVDRGVVVATPTTLIALLKAVAYGWQQDLIAESAREISALGRELHNRVGIMTRHLADLRRGLDRAVRAYNETVGSFERRVLPAARRFRDLGAANADIPQLEPIDRGTRDVESQDLFEQT
jgi:DNA recombination protein RmuC